MIFCRFQQQVNGKPNLKVKEEKNQYMKWKSHYSRPNQIKVYRISTVFQRNGIEGEKDRERRETRNELNADAG